MQAFVERVGLQDALGAPGGPQFIHVAGTNGKGSVTAYVQSILAEHGYSTGAFFSPFVYDPRERVQFGRELIPKDDLAALTEELMPIAESFSETPFGGITEFEFKTALGFLYWKRRECQWVALEVGLGGRLDATNVVTPRSSVIVSIGLDHTAILGHTHQEIAYEKAGVIKSETPVIVGEMNDEAFGTIEKVADELEAPIWQFEREVVWSNGSVSTPGYSFRGLEPGIKGARQGHNLALAIASMEAAGIPLRSQAVQEGARKAFAPGRFQEAQMGGQRYLFDGAHNPDAARTLMEGLARSLAAGEKVVLITNMVAGHDPGDFYQEIARVVRSAHVVPIDFHRALPPSETAASLAGLVQEVHFYADLNEGIEAARQDAGNDLILVTGSFYLVGEVGRALGYQR